ncbi:DMT family transporter [Azotobacter chroococcum]|uniref:DMT family transporter n=1 Tax=Azotobacter chroococcum TaxID=353 RepID=UPI000B5F55B3|nr:DMT family transporter [Azotobacter chroococcum]ASL27778.1 membrane protein [Azotobacter chroococcum]
MNTASHPFHGILLILAAGLVLASHDGMAKYLALSHPLILVVWARYLSQSTAMLLLFGPRRGLAIVRTSHPLLQLVRGLCLVAVSLLFVSSLRHIPIGEATAVLFLAPLFITGLSATLLRERVSRGQWGAVILGLLGVLVIVRPGGALFTPAALLPLGAALCLAVFMLLTRRLSESDDPVTCNFLSSLVGSLLLSLLVPFYWETPDLHDGLLLSVVGGVAMFGHLLLSHAYRYASAATLAPFTYSQLIFAVLVGLVAFGHVPDGGALLGIAIVIASGVLSVWVQRRTA